VPQVVPDVPLKAEPFNKVFDFKRDLIDVGVRDFAFDQVETYPWVSEKVLKALGVNLDSLVRIVNSVDPKATYLRQQGWWSLVDVTRKNYPYFDTIKVLDTGKAWDSQGNEYDRFFAAIFVKQPEGWQQSSYLALRQLWE